MSVETSSASPSADGRRADLARVGFGAGTMIAQGYGHVDLDEAREAVAAALDEGVRFFDTAHFYGSGRSESIVGEMVEGWRDQIRLCTKGGVRYTDPTDLRTLVCDSSYEGLSAFIEESLKRLRTDHVDVYLLHQFDPALSPEQQMENLARLQQDGLVEEVGFCNFGVDACRRALATGIPSVVEYSCSLLDRRYLGELRDAGQRGCTRITYGSYAHGLLSEGFTVDHEFDAEDWRGRSRREGSSGTSGNVFFAGDAFERYIGVADQLRVVADRYDLSMAAFVLALSARQPESDVALFGTRNAKEVHDGLRGLGVELRAEDLAEVEAIVSSVERPSVNLLGLPG
jgi:aryl-alcohol dehydrogenase-like predicted oxidoreductase